MSKTLLPLITGLAILCAGCNTVRRAIDVVDAAAGAVGGVKDDALGAVRTLVNSAEAVKTNVLTAAKATSEAATK